jgi:hypothetical protein
MSKILVAPLEALTDPELTDQERRVLLALFSYRGRLTENVWPTREQIGERANIKDLAAIGKRTSSLAKKGWLIKFKKGFSGHMTYTMQFPVRLETVVDTIGQPLEVESTSNALEVKSTSQARSNPPPHTRHHPPTALNTPINKPIKQTIYKKITLDPSDPLIDLYKEFIDYRIGLKHPLTQQMFDRFLGVVQVCCDELGKTPAWVIMETIDAGWRSCKPEWLRNRIAVNPKSDSIRKRSLLESLTDRSWAS